MVGGEIKKETFPPLKDYLTMKYFLQTGRKCKNIIIYLSFLISLKLISWVPTYETVNKYIRKHFFYRLMEMGFKPHHDTPFSTLLRILYVFLTAMIIY